MEDKIFKSKRAEHHVRSNIHFTLLACLLAVSNRQGLVADRPPFAGEALPLTYPTLPDPARQPRLEELHVIALLLFLGSDKPRFALSLPPAPIPSILSDFAALLCITPCRIRLINTHTLAMSMRSTSLSAFVFAIRYVSRLLDYGFEEALSESTTWSSSLLLW